ncbi:MAG: hypothetical protein WCI18_10770 [Pseudomonadota bacterium]
MKLKGLCKKIFPVLSIYLFSTCVSWQEPESDIVIRKIEVERKPKVERILVLPLTGSVDAEGLASGVIQSEAQRLLGKGASLVGELEPIYRAANAVELMPLALQPQMLWFEDLLAKTSNQNLVSGALYRFPGMEFGLKLEKDPVSTLKILAANSRQLESLSDALQKNDKVLFQEILNPQLEIKASLSKLQYWAEVQFQPLWIVAFYLDGSKDSWDKGHSVTLKIIALNFESGGIRFAGSSTLSPTAMPVKYTTMLTALTNTLIRKVIDSSTLSR